MEASHLTTGIRPAAARLMTGSRTNVHVPTWFRTRVYELISEVLQENRGDFLLCLEWKPCNRSSVFNALHIWNQLGRTFKLTRKLIIQSGNIDPLPFQHFSEITVYREKSGPELIQLYLTLRLLKKKKVPGSREKNRLNAGESVIRKKKVIMEREQKGEGRSS